MNYHELSMFRKLDDVQFSQRRPSKRNNETDVSHCNCCNHVQVHFYVRCKISLVGTIRDRVTRSSLLPPLKRRLGFFSAFSPHPTFLIEISASVTSRSFRSRDSPLFSQAFSRPGTVPGDTKQDLSDHMGLHVRPMQREGRRGEWASECIYLDSSPLAKTERVL